MTRTQKENLLSSFIEWARENSDDAWYIYDKPNEAIQKFIKHQKIRNRTALGIKTQSK